MVNVLINEYKFTCQIKFTNCPSAETKEPNICHLILKDISDKIMMNNKIRND